MRTKLTSVFAEMGVKSFFAAGGQTAVESTALSDLCHVFMLQVWLFESEQKNGSRITFTAGECCCLPNLEE